MTRHSNDAWPEDRVAKLRRLWAEGLSASQVAKELGGVTRNAVIGKVCRLKLPPRTKATRTYTRPPRNKKPRALTGYQREAFGQNRAKKRAPEAGLTPELRAIAALDPIDPSLKIIHAGALCCRYIRDPLGPVCGRVATEGAWCAEHRKLVYRPADSQERTRARVDRIVEMAR